jgi:hypothetical protein
MCNCTQKRDMLIQGTKFENISSDVYTVRGNVTQDVYRFQPGEVKVVDRRDVRGMENSTFLKKITAT